jgi:hypothetical protein
MINRRYLPLVIVGLVAVIASFPMPIVSLME